MVKSPVLLTIKLYVLLTASASCVKDHFFVIIYNCTGRALKTEVEQRDSAEAKIMNDPIEHFLVMA